MTERGGEIRVQYKISVTETPNICRKRYPTFRCLLDPEEGNEGLLQCQSAVPVLNMDVKNECK